MLHTGCSTDACTLHTGCSTDACTLHPGCSSNATCAACYMRAAHMLHSHSFYGTFGMGRCTRGQTYRTDVLQSYRTFRMDVLQGRLGLAHGEGLLGLACPYTSTWHCCMHAPLARRHQVADAAQAERVLRTGPEALWEAYT